MKLEVGEVRLDSDSGIAFGSRAAVPTEDRDDVASSLEPTSLAAVSVAAILVSSGFSAAALLLGFWPLVFPALLFAVLGVGSGVLAATRSRGEPSTLDSATVAELLRREGPLDADALTEALGWSERRLLRAVVELVDAGEVDEDLDVETGRWVYAASAGPDDHRRKSLTAVDRLEAIETEKKGVTIEN